MLSKKELDLIEQRISYIEKIEALCNAVLDQDLLIALDREVDKIVQCLALDYLQRKKRDKLRLVK